MIRSFFFNPWVIALLISAGTGLFWLGCLLTTGSVPQVREFCFYFSENDIIIWHLPFSISRWFDVFIGFWVVGFYYFIDGACKRRKAETGAIPSDVLYGALMWAFLISLFYVPAYGVVAFLVWGFWFGIMGFVFFLLAYCVL